MTYFPKLLVDVLVKDKFICKLKILFIQKKKFIHKFICETKRSKLLKHYPQMKKHIEICQMIIIKTLSANEI